MGIDRINKVFNINFGQGQNINGEVIQNISSLPPLVDTPSSVSNKISSSTEEKVPVTSLPSNFVNVNAPISYSKINEFTLPNSDTKVHIYKLANGQTVVLAPKKGETQINTYVKCGSMNEVESQRGISHFIEHNLFNGSKNINPKEFFNRVNKMGAYTNAWTSEFATSYLIQSQLFDSEDLSKIIALHADMVQYPKFDEAQLDKERGVVNSEITMYDDNNYRVMSGKAFKQLFQVESDSNDIIGGTVANINNLTRNDVISYYNKNYTPDKMTTILTGEFDPDEAIKLISKNFTKPLNPSAAPQYNVELNPIGEAKRIDYTSANINTDEFVLGFAGPKNNNLKDTLSMEIAIKILNGKSYSKLDKNLKPFGITPFMHMSQAGNQSFSPNFIEIAGTCKPEDTNEVLKTIYSCVHNAKHEDLSEDVDVAKKTLQKNIRNAFQTGNSINAFLGNYMSLYSIEEIEKLPEIVDSLTQQDIKSAMEKYLDLNKVSLVVAHPKTGKTAPSFKGRLEKKGIELDDYRYAKLQNNAEIYLLKDNSDLKDFILNFKTPLPADINPKTHEVLTRLLNRGANYQSEEDFSKDLSKHAGSIYFYSAPDGIAIAGNALKADIDFTLAKVIDTLNYPKFNEKDFEEVKKMMTHEIIEKNKSPMDCFEEVMFPQLKTVSTKEQELKALNEVKLSDVAGLMEYLKQNSSLHFCWNNNRIPYELNSLGNFKPHTDSDFRTYSPLKTDVIRAQADNSGQARIIQAFKFKQDKSPKEVAKLKILNSILGGQQSSRLFTDLRESQKLAYSVRSNIDSFGDTGLMILSIGTTTENPQDLTATSTNITKSLEGFKNNIAKLKSEPVTQEELETAKLTIKSNILNMIETNSGQMGKLVDDRVYFNDVNYTNKLLKEIDDVTVEDVLQTANKVFEGPSLTSIVAGEKTLKELNLQH